MREHDEVRVGDRFERRKSISPKWQKIIVDGLIKELSKPAPKPLPFERHYACAMDHDEPVMCLGCEAKFAEVQAHADKERWHEPRPVVGPPQPMSAGLGSMIGRYTYRRR